MITRRSLLTNLIAAVGATAAAPNLVFANDAAKKKRIPWQNWSGSQICYPQSRKAPANVEELQSLIT